MVASEKWHSRGADRKGRARTYAIGEAMIHKFEEKSPKVQDHGEAVNGLALLRLPVGLPFGKREQETNLYITSHRFPLDPLVFGLRGAEAARTPHFWVLSDLNRNKGSP
jgi:hypothetical protein